MRPEARWWVSIDRGRAGELHAASADRISVTATARAGLVAPARSIRVLEAAAPAVVVGSTQGTGVVDWAAARRDSVEVVRRRSGGAAVLVGPGRALWVDVTLPAGDRLWDPDVGRAGWWLGSCWKAALGDVGVSDAEVWPGPMVRTRWSPLVCFAGLGPGEITVAGQKLVGVSQRRTRLGVLFQCAVPLSGDGPTRLLARWDPRPLLDLLVLDAERRQQAVEDLADAAAVLRPSVAPTLAAALVERCRRAGDAADARRMP